MPHELRTFGGLGLRGPDGEPIEPELAPSKGTALLALLATRPPAEPVRREDVLPLLWPERGEAAARNALRSTLSRVRGELPAGAVGGKGEDRLWLDRSVLTSDVRAFADALEEDRPREALRHYRGPFLEHFRLPGVAPFERWADERRGAYRRRACGAALSVAEAAREAEAWAEAEDAYRDALDLAPLKEEAAAGLIRILAVRGARSDALRFYGSFRERLDEELDLSPSAEIEELADRIRSGSAGAAAAGPSAPVRGDADGGGRASSSAGDGEGDGSLRPGRPLALVSAVLLLLLGGAGLWFALRGGDGAGSDPSGAGRPAVAVLPFDRLGGTGEATPFVRGLHSDLVTRLSNVSGLAVLARTSVLPFRDGGLGVSAIADSLGAQWIVEGEVQQVGPQVQVNVQLVDARTGTHVWAESYRRELTAENVFAIQSDVAKRIVGSLEAELTRAERRRIERRPTEDLAAYRLYVQGRTHLDQRTETDIRRAARYFRRAIARDSAYALAWSGLADTRVLLVSYGYARADSLLPHALEAARRALEIDPNLAEAHASLGVIYKDVQRDGPAALAHFRRALELQPSYARVHHWLGLLYLEAMGRLDPALPHLERAAELSPLSPPIHVALSLVYRFRGRIGAALREARRVQELAPNYVSGPLWTGISLYSAGRPEEATAAFRRVLERTNPSPLFAALTRAWLAAAHHRMGDAERARALLARLEAEGYPFMAGFVHAAMGERDAAVEDLADAPYNYLRARMLHFEPVLDPLRDDPRFRELVRQVNVQWGLRPDGSVPDSVEPSPGTAALSPLWPRPLPSGVPRSGEPTGPRPAPGTVIRAEIESHTYDGGVAAWPASAS